LRVTESRFEEATEVLIYHPAVYTRIIQHVAIMSMIIGIGKF